MTSPKYLALFAVGEMRLVYSRWLISATTWSCCQEGWQSVECLWMIFVCVCAWAGHSLEGTLDWTDLLVLLVDVRQLGPGQIPHKRVHFFFENVCEKPLCFPAGIQNIHRKGLVLLSCQLAVLRCLAFMDFLG